MTMNTCPACAKPYSGNPPDCPSCGIFFAKWHARAAGPAVSPPSSSPAPFLAGKQVSGFAPKMFLAVLVLGVGGFFWMNMPVLSRMWERVGIMGQGKLTEQSFIEFIVQGDKEVVASYLKAGMSPNTEMRGSTVLSMAIEKGNPDVVDMLLKAGADPNKLDCSGRDGACFPPLIAALNRDFLPRSRDAIISSMLAHGANPDLADSHGRTPRSIAAQFGMSHVFGGPATDVAPTDAASIALLGPRFQAVLLSRDANELNAIAAAGAPAARMFAAALAPAQAEIASLAIEGLKRVPELPLEVEGPLLAYINDPMASVEREAVLVMARLPGTPPERVRRFEELLKSRTLSVQGMAMRVLGDMGSDARSSVPAIQAAAKTNRGLQGEARAAIAKIEGR